MDWDEELKRQAAISALLAPPEDGDVSDDHPYETDESVVKPDDTSDYHKLVNQTFNQTPIGQEPPGHIDLAPPGHIDLAPPKIATPPGLITDPDTGTRYLEDQEGGYKVPRAELATLADEQAFKPSDVTLPEQTVTGQGAPVQVKRPTTGFGVADPDPDNPNYKTPLSPDDEKKFQAWVKANNVPFDDSPTSDYDMRGFWKAAQEGDSDASTAVSKFDGKIHFNDKFKTPFHKTFSNESQYATSDAPHWEGDKLIDKDGNVVADETPPKQAYPAQIVTPDEAAGKTSVVNAPAAQAPPAAAQPEPAKPEVIQPKSSSDWDTLVNSIWPSAADKEKTSETTTTAAGDLPPMINAPNGQAPVALIIHHTGGNNSAESVVNDWRTNRPGVGAQMIMDRDGVIHETNKEFGYNGTGNFLHSVIPGVSNQTAVGIEVIAKDDADMTPAQLASLQRLAGPKGPYAKVPVYGHSQVSPGDRENEGVRGVNAIMEARAGGGTATTDTDVASTIDSNLGGLLANKGAVYAEMGAKYGVDPKLLAAISILETGHGTSNILATRNNVAGLGGGSTSFNSIDESIEAEAKNLRDNYLNQGLTSIGDIGAKWAPPGASNDAGGNKDWPAEVAQLYAKLGGSGQLDTTAKTTTAGPEKMPWDDWVKLSPEDQATADKAGQAKQQEILTGIRDKTPSLPAFVRALEQPIQGVSDPVRLAAAAEFKKQITAYAQDYYKEPNPDKAYARIMGNADAGTLLGEIGSKILPNLSHAGLSFAQQAISASPLLQFINVAEPNATPEARLALVKQVMAQPDEDRTQFIKNLYSHLGSDQAQNVDLNALLNWSDTISQPGVKEEQAKRLAGINAAVAQNRKDLREDPTLQGTLGGTIANAIAAYPKNFLEAVTPYLGQSVMAAEIYSDTKESLRQEHPSWTEDQLSAHAAAVSIPQDVLQELINVGTLGLGGGALRGIENPIARMATSAIVHGTVTGTAGVGQQAVASLAAGKTPTAEELIQAGVGGFSQGFIGGAVGGRHGAEVKPELGEVPVLHEPETRPLPRNVVGGGLETAEPQLETTPLTPDRAVRTSDVLGPAEPGAPRAVTATDVLGTREEYPPEAPLPWYKEGVTPAERQDPLVIRGQERTTFTPQELDEAVSRLPGSTPEQLKAILEKLQSPAGVHLGEDVGAEIAQAQAAQKQAPQIQFWKTEKQRAAAEQAWIKARAGESVGTEIARSKAAAALGGAPPSPTQPVARPGSAQDPATQAFRAKQLPPRPGSADAMTGNAGVEEPWESAIANKYARERMEAGEIGHVEPGTGKTTEELLAQGLKMGPEEINQHKSDIMHGVGDPVKQTAAIRAEEARLSHRSHEASLAAEADPNNQAKQIAADNALKDLTDLYNGPMRRLKQNWHRQGVAFQDRIPIDLSTYNGIRSEFIKSTGKKPEQISKVGETEMRKASRQVRESSDAYKAKMKNLADEVSKDRRKLPTIDKVAEDVMRIMKGQDPCPV